jgi:hypothetical protein
MIILSNIQRLDDLLLDSNICIKAVKQDGFALQYVKEQTEKICIQAIKRNGLALQFVKEQTETLKNTNRYHIVEPILDT